MTNGFQTRMTNGFQLERAAPKRGRRILALLLIALFGAACSGQGSIGDGNTPPRGGPPGDPTSQPVHDTIAYASAGGDEIRLIDPDGSNDRALWAHGRADPDNVYDVWNMSWNPDATELAFVSSHENWCSIYASDVFAIGADGDGYRRITQAPSCADLASYPQGTVSVPIVNTSFDSFTGFLYFQGAAGVELASLAPSGTGVVTFENVADFGAGDDGLQVGAIIYGTEREIAFSTVADVIAGGTVTTAETAVYAPGITWEVRSPSWSADGTRIAHLLNFDGLWQLPRNPQPLEFGTSLLAEDASPDDFVALMAAGPTSATADQLLYAKSFSNAGVYLAEEGSATLSPALVAFGSVEAVLGLAWLPDGSGFVYSVTEGNSFSDEYSANLHHYDLGTGEVRQITSFVGDFAGQVSVSGDGQRLVFERAAELDGFGGAPLDPDLWLVNLDGSGLELLVEGAYAPAWSW